MTIPFILASNAWRKKFSLHFAPVGLSAKPTGRQLSKLFPARAAQHGRPLPHMTHLTGASTELVSFDTTNERQQQLTTLLILQNEKSACAPCQAPILQKIREHEFLS